MNDTASDAVKQIKLMKDSTTSAVRSCPFREQRKALVGNNTLTAGLSAEAGGDSASSSMPLVNEVRSEGQRYQGVTRARPTGEDSSNNNPPLSPSTVRFRGRELESPRTRE